MKKIFIAALCVGLFVSASSVSAQQAAKAKPKAKVENAEKATVAKGTTKACCAANTGEKAAACCADKKDGTKAACCADKKDGTKAACCADKKSSCSKAAVKPVEKKTN